MVSSTSKWIAFLVFAFSPLIQASSKRWIEPDSIVLKNGKTVKGVIIKNTATEVVLQQKTSESCYLKSDIIRIHDQSNSGMEFTESLHSGDLPSWRVMVNDIRLNDSIKSLEQIPATTIDNGILKNIPYMSFRMNEYIELNIYGDPNDPAAIEFGIYGKNQSNDKMRRVLRSFMAGFLSSREEVGAIYAIPFSGGTKAVGPICLQITPASAPDAYGAWWIQLYNPKKLESSRLSDADYDRLTMPPHQVVDRSGKVRENAWSGGDLAHSSRLKALGGKASIFLRGFYRDASGQFRIGSPESL